MNAIKKYFQGSMEEFRHVTWPTKKQTIRLTIICTIFTLSAAFFLGLVDYLLTYVFVF